MQFSRETPLFASPVKHGFSTTRLQRQGVRENSSGVLKIPTCHVRRNASSVLQMSQITMFVLPVLEVLYMSVSVCERHDTSRPILNIMAAELDKQKGTLYEHFIVFSCLVLCNIRVAVRPNDVPVCLTNPPPYPVHVTYLVTYLVWPAFAPGVRPSQGTSGPHILYGNVPFRVGPKHLQAVLAP